MLQEILVHSDAPVTSTRIMVKKILSNSSRYLLTNSFTDSPSCSRVFFFFKKSRIFRRKIYKNSYASFSSYEFQRKFIAFTQESLQYIQGLMMLFFQTISREISQVESYWIFRKLIYDSTPDNTSVIPIILPISLYKFLQGLVIEFLQDNVRK